MPSVQGSSTAVAPSSRRIPLKPRMAAARGGLGCLPMLGTPMAGIGLLLVAMGTFVRPDQAESTLQIGLGVVLLAAGLGLAVVRIRRTAAQAAGVTELAMPADARLVPGSMIQLHVIHHGPARLRRLAVALICERLVEVPAGAAASGTEGGRGEEQGPTVAETPWRVDALAEVDVRLGRGGRLERDLLVTIPGLGKPTGPTLPAGEIRWSFIVEAETTGGRTSRAPYDIVVTLDEEDDKGRTPAVGAGRPDAGTGGTPLTAADWRAGLGCFAITLGFLIVGPTFLFLYFGGATTKRGNPVMGLVGGVVFTLVGLAAAWIGLTSRKTPSGRPRRYGKNDPRRLP